MATKTLNENDDVENEELTILEDNPEFKKKPEGVDEHDEDDNEEGDDRPVKAADETDDEREAIRERRRLEKVERKERRDKAITRDKTELTFLRTRNDELEKRMSAQEQRAHQNDLGNIDTQLRNAINEVDMAEKVIAKAVAVGNGDDVTQAMRYRDQAIKKAQELNSYKQQFTAPKPVANNGIDEQTMKHAQGFLEKNKWYDPQGRDEDSAIVLAIDQALSKDGYDPKTAEYWDELNKRAARRLPEKFTSTKPEVADRSPRGGPAVGSGREHAPASTRKEIYISPERKQALVDAGVWDDPTLRMKYVKRYAEYDRNNKS
jgi:hypothetical protein